LEKSQYDKFEIINNLKGKEMKYISYTHPFGDFYKDHKEVKNNSKVYQTHITDYVNIEDGTGIVTINGAFGEIDMAAAKEIGLPIVVNVRMDGTFTNEMREFSGMKVKSIEDSQKTDIEIIKYMAHNNTLFAKEKYEHSYPHCWRCDTPLLNYATSSWFVKVTEIKDKMVKNNQKIKWVPDYIKEGRFGKWLEDARDWAVSRSRYWGAPLPIWRCEKCENIEVINSVDDLRNKTDQKITKFILLRHGESESNVKKVKAGQIDGYPLTQKGIKQVKNATETLKKKKIDIIISSPVLRTKQTAEIISKKLGIKYIKDERIREYDFGSWNGHGSDDAFCEENKIYQEYRKLKYDEEKYNFKLGGDGESRREIEERVRKFIKEITKKYAGKNILVVGHGGINAMFHKVIKNTSIKDTYKYEFTLDNAKQSIFYTDENKKEFNLHKPNIDKIKIKCSKCGSEAKIVGDVFDCWFESGSMPYAQWHYPFENQDKFKKGFPAEFIAEGLDQTRGWFYTLMVLSTALFSKSAFKNVIVNGIVMAEDGQKMSKRLKNYPEPNLLIEKYGADALRYYLLTSPVMKAENLNFSERGVEEVLKRFILTLWNVYSFLVMNADLTPDSRRHVNVSPLDDDVVKSSNLLDKWIISELNILIKEINGQMQNYDLVRASRPLREFVDKLSNWYVRRSRKRFTSENIEDGNSAFQTLYYVLAEYSKLMAPFMPFLAEEIYRNLTGKESVHLEDFPKVNKKLINKKVSREMNFVRDVVALGLAIRAKNSLKVRQPLLELRIMNHESRITEELLDLIKDELNVKNVEFVESLQVGSTQENGANNVDDWILEEDGNLKVALNLNITDELKLEGQARELVRHIQVMRKEAKYNRDDIILVEYSFAGENKDIKKVFEKWGDYIKKECLVKEIIFSEKLDEDSFDLAKELEIGNLKLEIGIKRV
ncbi:class I tRNA ligase family protein, partial [Candidatus Parcubacteria bacterium]|nr:class I tRNA ligase family protein [Candidatus Parcubacteria bacterium]